MVPLPAACQSYSLVVLCLTAPQEYLGSYVPDEHGRLVFREGALVTAVRQGQWVVLDELNLAPSEVLEALNRWAAWGEVSHGQSLAWRLGRRLGWSVRGACSKEEVVR